MAPASRRVSGCLRGASGLAGRAGSSRFHLHFLCSHIARPDGTLTEAHGVRNCPRLRMTAAPISVGARRASMEPKQSSASQQTTWG